jgi:hypothetical protein
MSDFGYATGGFSAMVDDQSTPAREERRDRRSSGAAVLRSIFTLGLSADPQGLRFWELLSIAGFALGLVIVAIYASATPAFAVTFGVLAALGAAAWLSGGVLGFLFGVPRLRAASAQSNASSAASTFVPNTNLEQISDWLTKIIVGAALVQLRVIAEDVNGLALAVGQALGTRGGAVISGGVMVLYFAGGFMWGYLWCSLRIFREMSALTDREQAVSVREANIIAPAGE